MIVFTDTFFETNGVASYYKTLLNWCRDRGEARARVRVTVLCPARDDLEVSQIPEGVVPVKAAIRIRNPAYKMLTLGYYPQAGICRTVKAIGGPKVVHVATSGTVGIVGAMVSRRLKLPLVGYYHTDLQRYGRLYGRSVLGRPGEWLGGLATGWCDRLAYRHCKALYVPSESAATTVSEFYAGKIEVVSEPVDVDWFRPAPTRDGPFHRKYCRNGAVLAAVVGRLAKEKNLDLVCELLGNDERISLVFVGDGPYAETLKKRWGVPVTGFLHGEELRAAFQQSDLFVQLSTTETFGLSLVEALSCGLPAVVLRSRGIAGTIPPGRGVKVLEREELASLADHCLELAADEARHRQHSRRARNLALRFGADTVLPSLVDLHRRVAR